MAANSKSANSELTKRQKLTELREKLLPKPRESRESSRKNSLNSENGNLNCSLLRDDALKSDLTNNQDRPSSRTSDRSMSPFQKKFAKYWGGFFEISGIFDYIFSIKL